MTHWSCTKQRIKQGHFETIQKEMKHGKKAHYFYRCFVSCSNCNVQVSPALGSVVPASCLESLSSASSTARAWQLLPWALRGWGSKNLAADGSICTSNPPGKNLPPSSLLKLKIEDKKLLPPTWKSDRKTGLAQPEEETSAGRRKLLPIYFTLQSSPLAPSCCLGAHNTHTPRSSLARWLQALISLLPQYFYRDFWSLQGTVPSALALGCCCPTPRSTQPRPPCSLNICSV